MKLFKCNKCGNIVLVNGNEKLLKCCGESLCEIEVSSGEGEGKHKPVIKIEDNQVCIRVGEIMHPMEEEHYIEWIYVIGDKCSSFIKFKPGDVPECIVPYSENMQVFAYCNKHLLWKNEL